MLYVYYVSVSAGGLYTWGSNQYGQLGLGQGYRGADQPQMVRSLQVCGYKWCGYMLYGYTLCVCCVVKNLMWLKL